MQMTLSELNAGLGDDLEHFTEDTLPVFTQCLEHERSFARSKGMALFYHVERFSGIEKKGKGGRTIDGDEVLDDRLQGGAVQVNPRLTLHAFNA